MNNTQNGLLHPVRPEFDDPLKAQSPNRRKMSANMLKPVDMSAQQLSSPLASEARLAHVATRMRSQPGATCLIFPLPITIVHYFDADTLLADFS